jgi:threonyl-tRNA synthetase
MLVVGDREQDAGRVSVRRHREGDVGDAEVAELAQSMAAEVAEKRARKGVENPS